MELKVTNVYVSGNSLTVDYLTEGIENAEFFKTGQPFFCEYSEDISNTPKSLAVIPFIVNVLPIVWLCDWVLTVDELDKDFYNCIDVLKKAYKKMYPEAKFLGSVKARTLVDNSYEPSNKVSAFFSGGLDAFHTLTRHLDEKPDLITIWGSDLHITDIDGWNVVKEEVQKTGKEYGLKNVFIKSSFADFLEERKLSYKFWDVIHGYWYHNIQHGIGMLGLIAPYAYKYKIKTHYIASSYDDKKLKIECASDPSIDNNLKMASCQIVHDAFGVTRQRKIHEIIDYRNKTGKTLDLRVCWAVKDGTNCCHCEKCYRTICGIIVEGEDPKKYNFPITDTLLKQMKEYLTLGCEYGQVVKSLWVDIQDRFIQNKWVVKKTNYYKYVSWLKNFNFDDIKSNKVYKKRQRKIRFYSIVCKILPRKVKDFLKKFIK